jgi:predicted hydrocarbon binding protein
VRIDRAIAEVVAGESLEETLRQMGRHSAVVNLGGVYKIFVKDEPHRFFKRMTTLHGRFQSFGEPAYEEITEKSGRIQIEGCNEYSKIYCWSALGYYQGALEMMKVPGPIKAVEASCQCEGDPNCVFDLHW